MRLEKIALWRETGLFTEQADGSRGYLGLVRGAFAGDEISIDAGQLHIPAEARYEYETLLCFLRSADASFLLKSAAAMTAVCSERLQCHIPYAFGRECYGFRVLSERCAWYIACTPWNAMKPFAIYAYDRTKLMTALAKEVGLPETCYGVTPYSGERMRIRYGDNCFEPRGKQTVCRRTKQDAQGDESATGGNGRRCDLRLGYPGRRSAQLR